MNALYIISGLSLASNGAWYLYLQSLRKKIRADIDQSSLLDREYTKAKYDFLNSKVKDYSDAKHADSARMINELDEDLTVDLKSLHEQIEELKECHDTLADSHSELKNSHSSLIDNHESLVKKHDEIATVQKEIKASEPASCSKCHAKVVRYVTHEGNVICANCHPQTF